MFLHFTVPRNFNLSCYKCGLLQSGHKIMTIGFWMSFGVLLNIFKGKQGGQRNDIVRQKDTGLVFSRHDLSVRG